MIIDDILSPGDVKELNIGQLKALCEELRAEILTSVSKNGGHLASNLGAVELTVAIEKTFSLPQDKLIFDVGHQSYAHKLLTGRRNGFEKLRTDGGVSGFTKRSESVYDAFGSGHSGNALSSAVGIAEADRLSGGGNYTIAVLGDGSFTNGMTYEALNNCADSDLKLIIILNDNEMAISRNVGSIDNVFSRMRVSRRYFRMKNNFVHVFSSIPLIGKPIVRISRKFKGFLKRMVLKENFFETFGFEYIGPVDGNDIEKLLVVLNQAKSSRHPCIVHTYTKKGKGYTLAEEKPDSYHSVPKFDISSGVVPNGNSETFSYNAGKFVCNEGKLNEKLCCITAAMTAGTGLSSFAEKYGNRFFDVGIAEEHAVTFCAGLSAGGYKPLFAVYSTFLQRSFDQLTEDVAMQGLDITLLIDRAGVVADDGITHHGIFDVSLLNQIPNSLIYAPVSIDELEKYIHLSIEYYGVSAVRYAKGKPTPLTGEYTFTENTAYCDYGAPEKVIMTYGRLTAEAEKAAYAAGNTRVVRLIRLNPLDKEEIKAVVGDMPILFAEEGTVSGGVGIRICNMTKNNVTVCGIENDLPEHGTYQTLLYRMGLDSMSLTKKLKSL